MLKTCKKQQHKIVLYFFLWGGGGGGGGNLKLGGKIFPPKGPEKNTDCFNFLI